jgi:hypothetical protein
MLICVKSNLFLNIMVDGLDGNVSRETLPLLV